MNATALPPPGVARLRERLRAIGGDGLQRRRVLPFGAIGIDARLGDGGLRLDALHEVAAATASLEDHVTATLFAAGIAARAWGPILWVVRGRDLFAPALHPVGLAPERIVYAEAADDAEVVALMEEGLRHPALGAVIGEVRRAALPATRRLHHAAEGGRTIALLRRHALGGADPFAGASAAVTRWRIGSVAGDPARAPAATRARWRLSLAHQQGGEPFGVTVGACDVTGRVALRAGPVVAAHPHDEPVAHAA